MQFKTKVQFLGQKQNNEIICYDFLSLEYNLPFSVYSLTPISLYDKYEVYHNYDTIFDLVLTKDQKKGIVFKVKGVDVK